MQEGGRKIQGSLRENGRVAAEQKPSVGLSAGRARVWASRGIHYFPKTFLVRFLVSKNEEENQLHLR